jgi:hypothetical protein
MKSADFNFPCCQITAIIVMRLNMKFYSLIISLLITANGLLILTIGPVLADDQAKARRRQVRVTTGIGSVQGWETGLVEKNPNLARWHWDPIYYYKQGYGPVTSRGLNLKLDGKPTGKQSINRSTQTGLSYQTPAWHDVKPEHIPYPPQVMVELQGRLYLPKKSPENPLASKDSVLGKLMSEQVKGEHIATYNNILPERQNSLNTALKYSSQTTSVYGQLLNNKPAHRNHSFRKGHTNRGGNVPKKNQ